MNSVAVPNEGTGEGPMKKKLDRSTAADFDTPTYCKDMAQKSRRTLMSVSANLTMSALTPCGT